jgi:hypothetical protein
VNAPNWRAFKTIVSNIGEIVFVLLPKIVFYHVQNAFRKDSVLGKALKVLSRYRAVLWIVFFYLTLRNFGEIRDFLSEIFGADPEYMSSWMIVVLIFWVVAALGRLSVWKSTIWAGLFLLVMSNLDEIYIFVNSVIIFLGVEPQYTIWVWLVIGLIVVSSILTWLGFTDRDIAMMTYLNILFK